MRKTIRIHIGLVLLAALSCSANRELPVRHEASPIERGLSEFFSLCAADAVSGAGVVEKHDIVKMLTHFLRMDGGGKKYYLLEREHIAEMILTVTEGLYRDFILVNRRGVVVYSREKEDIFGKSVLTGLAQSPLARCFANREKPLHVEDVDMFPVISGSYGIFISSRIVVENTFHGLFILQADIDRIIKYLNGKTQIVDYEGNYRIASPKELILTECPFHRRIKAGVPGRFTEEGRTYESTPFEFKGIRWMILSEL